MSKSSPQIVYEAGLRNVAAKYQHSNLIHDTARSDVEGKSSDSHALGHYLELRMDPVS